MRAHVGAATLLGALALLCAAAPVALAQDAEPEPEPDLNESDFDTSAPPDDDERYLDEEDASAASAQEEPEPSLAENDFDMSVPRTDDAYLDAPGADAASEDDAQARVPAPGMLALVGVVGLAALALRRRA